MGKSGDFPFFFSPTTEKAHTNPTDQTKKLCRNLVGERKIIGCHFSPSEMAYCAQTPCKRAQVSAAWCKSMSRSEPRRGSVVVVKHTHKKQPTTLQRITQASRLFFTFPATTTDPLRGSYHRHISPHAALTGARLRGGCAQ